MIIKREQVCARHKRATRRLLRGGSSKTSEVRSTKGAMRICATEEYIADAMIYLRYDIRYAYEYETDIIPYLHRKLLHLNQAQNIAQGSVGAPKPPERESLVRKSSADEREVYKGTPSEETEIVNGILIERRKT